MRNSLELGASTYQLFHRARVRAVTYHQAPILSNGGAHRMSTRTHRRRPRRRRGRSTMIWQNEQTAPQEDDADHHDSMEVDSFESNQLHHQRMTSKTVHGQVIYYGAPVQPEPTPPVPSTSGPSPNVPSSGALSTHLTSQIPNVPAEQTVSRPILKARRPFANRQYICVLDTNVLIDDLNAIKSWILNYGHKAFPRAADTTASSSNSTQSFCRQSLPKSPLYQIVVPAVVFQELDGLKNSNRNRGPGRQAQNAIKFLNEQLKVRNGLLQAEPDKNPETRMSEYTMPVENNDDRILECCVRIGELFADKTVILLSDDINLRNKALMWHVEATTINCFNKEHLAALKDHKPQQSQLKSMTSSIPKVEEEEEEINSMEKLLKPAKRFKSLAHSAAIKEEEEKALGSLQSISSVETVHQLAHSLRETLNGGQVPSNQSVESPAVPNNATRTSPPQEEMQLKYQLEEALIHLICSTLAAQYGDQWASIFPRYNPKTATLFESLTIIKNNWMGVFSDTFRRNQKILELIKRAIERKTALDQGKLNTLYSQLFDFVQKASTK